MEPEVDLKARISDLEEMYKRQTSALLEAQELNKVLGEALEKYKDMVWRTGTNITTEESYAARTALEKFKQMRGEG